MAHIATTTLRFRAPANTRDLKQSNTMDSTIHIPQISHDLLHPIFEYLESDKTLLCNISLVSATFREEAQRILFRDVTSFYTYNSYIKFLRTVAASPTRLALFVHSYAVFYPDHDTENFDKILPTVVRDGLKAMHRLKELTIFISTTSPSYSHRIPTIYICILSTCTFTLERFAWKETNMNVYELIEKFLPYQTTLRHLELDRELGPDPLYLVPSTTCPRLVSLHAGWSSIKAFLPGHKISAIFLKYTSTRVSEADFMALATELKCIEALSIDFSLLQEREALDHPILHYCTSLNALEINNIQPKTYEDDDEAYPPIEVPELLGMLSHLPELQTLILSGDMYYRNRQEDTKLAHHAFANFGQHLKYINFETFKGYDRHIQSQEILQDIDEEEVRKWWLPTF